MTNSQIIEGVARSVYGDEAVDSMIRSGVEIPLHTVQGWNSRGPYRVKKGEHGIETKLWKKKTGKNNDDEDTDQGFYLVKSYLFTEMQVEKLEQTFIP